ncbi:MAG: ABC transporter ATP-binding protein [Clostridia bacterium]|nr:ABC transporter ATP-binding protein [Clostridia bacterium]
MEQTTQKVVEINGLYKRYGKSNDYAIADINITCNAGEIVGLLGRNGAGKSTTIKCLTGFFQFDKGTIKICDHDIKKEPIQAKQLLGYVPDNRAMFDKMTGMEYINFVADLHGTPQDERQARIDEFQQIFNLGDKIYDMIASYSHGMRQKVCLMASLIHQPKLWLLDEPLTGLDPQTSKALHDYMQIYKQRGNCVMYSSHNLAAVEKTCDRAYIINKGRIVANIDIHEFVRNNPNTTLEEAFITQFEEE